MLDDIESRAPEVPESGKSAPVPPNTRREAERLLAKKYRIAFDENRTAIDPQLEGKISVCTDLHNKIIGAPRELVVNAAALGLHLESSKNLVGHGNFQSWVSDRMPFGPKQAQLYMQIARRKDELLEEVSDDRLLPSLRAIRAYLTSPKPTDVAGQICDLHAVLVEAFRQMLLELAAFRIKWTAAPAAATSAEDFATAVGVLRGDEWADAYDPTVDGPSFNPVTGEPVKEGDLTWVEDFMDSLVGVVMDL